MQNASASAVLTCGTAGREGLVGFEAVRGALERGGGLAVPPRQGAQRAKGPLELLDRLPAIARARAEVRRHRLARGGPFGVPANHQVGGERGHGLPIGLPVGVGDAGDARGRIPRSRRRSASALSPVVGPEAPTGAAPGHRSCPTAVTLSVTILSADAGRVTVRPARSVAETSAKVGRGRGSHVQEGRLEHVRDR